MFGCPNCVYVANKDIEICKVTGEPTNGAVMCDFEFDDCEIYNRGKDKGNSAESTGEK
jgi:hypothetical protein